MTPNIEWTPKGSWTDYSNTTRAPGYTLLGLSAEAVVRDGVTLFLDARNLTGTKAVGDISAVIMSDTATVAYYPVERRAVSRSEERRVGKEWVSPFRSRWSQEP